MAISERIPPPAFVDLEVTAGGGLDVLGLRLPGQSIRDTLLNGVTTVTPTVRYLSLRTWLLHRYATAKPRPPDRYSAFVEYARRAESAFVLGNLMLGQVDTTLVGSREATRRLIDHQTNYPLDPLAEQPATRIYAGPSQQLRLTEAARPSIPKLGRENGLPLVEAVEEALGKTVLGERLRSANRLDRASPAELTEFGQAADVRNIPEAERQALIRAILPEAPLDDERPRLATYAALLALGGPLAVGQSLGDEAMIGEAVRPDRRIPRPLWDILDGWLLYAVRDAIAVPAEFTLQTMRDALERLDPEGSGIDADLLVGQTLADSMAEQEETLREFGLLEVDETLRGLSLTALADRTADCTFGTVVDRGIRRWSGGLTEPAIYGAAKGVGPGAIALGILGWLMVERRVGTGVREGEHRTLPLSRGLARRIGLKQVVLPRLDQWRQEDLAVEDVLGEYAHIVIDQHLRIAWSRMAQDPKRDISVLHRDGNRLMVGASFGPGRAATRLKEAIGWLEQLQLLDGRRTTAEGRAVLERAVEALS